MAMRQWDGGPKKVKADGGGGFLGGAIQGFTQGVAALSLEEFQQEQRRRTAEIEREAQRVLEEARYKRGRSDTLADRADEREYQEGLLVRQAEATDRADLTKRERDLADFASEKEIEEEMYEARANGDHERALELAEMKEKWQQEYGSPGSTKKEDMKEYRAATVFDFATTIAPDVPLDEYGEDPEKTGYKSIVAYLQEQGDADSMRKARLITQLNRELQGKSDPDEIEDIYEKYQKKLSSTADLRNKYNLNPDGINGP